MIVIPMAGVSQRFRDAGYGVPKYMLPVSGRPLFDWVMLSFARYFTDEVFVFVAHDTFGTHSFLRERLASLGIQNAEVVLLKQKTGGQAETVEAGITEVQLNNSSELIIFNIDTIRPKIDLSPIPGAAGWLESFSAPGDSWSFIEIDPINMRRVVRSVEKERISSHCCTGLYAFSTAETFLEALEKERLSPASAELYVAPLYNHIIEAGRFVSWKSCPSKDVILSGVPREYEALVENGVRVRDFFE